MPFTPEHQARIDAGRRAHYAKARADWARKTPGERWLIVLTEFGKKMPVGEPDECWPWNEFCVKRGTYGTFQIRGTGDYAHRLAYRWGNEHWAGDAVVRHTCDYKPCVNPAHLLLGTQGDNVRDAYERNQITHQRKISDAQVRELDARYRAGGVSMTELAREYSISVPTVSEIVNRKKRLRAFAVA